MHSTADTRERARIVPSWQRGLGIAGLLSLMLAACVTTQPSPSAVGEPVPSPGTTAVAPAAASPPATETPAKPPGVCKPDPFCMVDCKRQDYPTGYCNLRCGC